MVATETRAVTGTDRRNAWQRMTDMVLNQLAQGIVPWRRPWRDVDFARPHNALTKKPYRGVNLLALSFSEFSDPRWCTPNQAKFQLGGRVKDDEWANYQTIVFWKRMSFQKKNERTGQDEEKAFPWMRFTRAYNVEQCEGLNIKPLAEAMPKGPERKSADATYAEVKGWLDALPDAPRVMYGGNRAAYSHVMDSIFLPHDYAFDTLDAHYAAHLHELGHASGHSSRLNRAELMSGGERGGEDYSTEELTADFFAWFMGMHFGLNVDGDNHASYIATWASRLRSDPKMVVLAVGRAQKASDYFLSMSEEPDDTQEDE